MISRPASPALSLSYSSSDSGSQSGHSSFLPITVHAFVFITRRAPHFLPSSTHVDLCAHRLLVATFCLQEKSPSRFFFIVLFVDCLPCIHIRRGVYSARFTHISRGSDIETEATLQQDRRKVSNKPRGIVLKKTDQQTNSGYGHKTVTGLPWYVEHEERT